MPLDPIRQFIAHHLIAVALAMAGLLAEGAVYLTRCIGW